MSILNKWISLAKRGILSPLLLLLIPTNAFCQPETDYSDLSNWYYHPDQSFNFLSLYGLDIAVIDEGLNIDSVISIENNAATNTGVDVFFVHPTILDEYPIVPDTVAISDQNLLQIGGTIIAQGGLLSKYGRVYAPKYRQASPPCFYDFYPESERAEYLKIAYSDIKNAFLDYIENHNNGNKFIIAGHSQGSFLLGLLLRDIIDNDPDLRAKMVTAALGGMSHTYAAPGEFQGGWWENIPLCTTSNECGCIHNWRTYKENQIIPEPNTGLPEFNQVLIDEGLVFRSPDLESDWFVEDSLFYGIESEPLRYYIAPDAGYDIADEYNFIAFDSLYNVRYKRTENLKVGMAIAYTNNPSDLRPNDLLPEEGHPNYDNWGFHRKDYHIYLWALMQQIDEKLIGCSNTVGISNPGKVENVFTLYPNPNRGTFTLTLPNSPDIDETVTVYDLHGRRIMENILKSEMQISLENPGIYLIKTNHFTQKVLVIK